MPVLTTIKAVEGLYWSKVVEGLQMFPKLVLTTTKLVESLYRIVIACFAVPVESL